MGLYAVFGSPIGHSLSPRIHNSAFAEEGMECAYIPVEVAPDRLLTALDAFARLGGRGVNLTRPLKETVFAYLDEVSPWAEAAGAANTLAYHLDGWYGDNTDVRALIDALNGPLADRPTRRALVVGAGGVARGSVVALRELGCEITVASRHKIDWPNCTWTAMTAVTRPAAWAVVVNATPLGQHGEANWPYLPHLVAGETIVVDWVYHPLRTTLIARAMELGCPTVDGIGLLIGQARWAWQTWFGRMGPEGPMVRALCAP